MPTYHTPPQTPLPSSTYTLPSHSRSNSYFPSSPSFRRLSSSTTASKPRISSEVKDGTKKAVPYIFLGSIAAASLLAHKYWPKGYPHGEKEDWELSKWARRAKQKKLEEKAARKGKKGKESGSRSRRGSDASLASSYSFDASSRGSHARGRRGSRQYYTEEAVEVGYKERGRSRERAPSHVHGYGHRRSASSVSISRSRSRSRSVSRGPDRRRLGGHHGGEPAYRRASSSRERQYAYPAAGPSSGTRYLLEAAPRASSPVWRCRSPSSERNKGYDFDRRPSEAVYVYRELPPKRTRRVSFDAATVRRHEESMNWRSR